jgi:succinate-semialdehyde dehydrogenase
MHRDDEAKFVAELKEQKAYYAESEEEAEKFRKALFPDGAVINKNVVGQNPQVIAKEAGISIPQDTRVIVVKGENGKIGSKDVLCGEKMCPVIVTFTYDTLDSICQSSSF